MLISFRTANRLLCKRPSVDAFKVENHDLDIEVTVENSEACPHYAGVTVKGVTVKESPNGAE